MEGTFDLILASEVLHLPRLHGRLLSTISGLLKPSGDTLVFLSFKRRGLGEEAFFDRARREGWRVEEVQFAPETWMEPYTLVKMRRKSV